MLHRTTASSSSTKTLLLAIVSSWWYLLLGLAVVEAQGYSSRRSYSSSPAAPRSLGGSGSYKPYNPYGGGYSSGHGTGGFSGGGSNHGGDHGGGGGHSSGYGDGGSSVVRSDNGSYYYGGGHGASSEVESSEGESDPKGMSMGIIVGLVAAVVALGLLVVACSCCLCCLCCQRKKKEDKDEAAETAGKAPGRVQAATKQHGPHEAAIATKSSPQHVPTLCSAADDVETGRLQQSPSYRNPPPQAPTYIQRPSAAEAPSFVVTAVPIVPNEEPDVAVVASALAVVPIEEQYVTPDKK